MKRAGLVTALSRASVFMVLLLPAALYGIETGESTQLLVPDISYFPDSLQLRQFTCRAVTANAYWLVQDTSFIDLPAGEDEFQLIWGNIITQAGIDTISAQFEGAGVDVFESVTSALGPVPETPNDDDRLWIVFTDISDYYPNPGAGYSRLGNWVYVWPEDFDGDESTGNNHDIIYINAGPYKNLSGDVWESNRLKSPHMVGAHRAGTASENSPQPAGGEMACQGPRDVRPAPLLWSYLCPQRVDRHCCQCWMILPEGEASSLLRGVQAREVMILGRTLPLSSSG